MKHQVIKWLNVFSVVFLIAALAVSFVVFTATQGAIASWDGTIDSTFASGSGSESNPYVIETEQQLGLLLANLSSGVNFEGLYLRLDSDLDMTGATWTPGDFAGTLDGCGHVIKADCMFLKSLSETGTVKRLVYAVETELSTTVFIDTNNGLIESCVVYGTVDSSGTAGVLCDDNYGNIRNCGCIGSSTGNCAGMVAYFHTGTIEHCYSAMTVRKTGGGRYSSSYGGPLYARKDYDTVISDSYYNSTLYTSSCTQGGGLSTEEMTSEAFTETMNGSLYSGCYWVQSDEDSLFEGYPLPVPCYDASTSLTYTDEKVALFHTATLSTKLSASDSGTIYYTLDGTNPITSSTRKTYSANSTLTFSGDVTVRSVVCYNGEYSAVNTQKLIQLLGAGTESDPYRIYNNAQLDAIRMDTTASYRLMDDLEFTEEDYAANGVAPGGWTPIPGFSGTFDGDSHAIYGLKGTQGGLFNSNSGIIENLRLIDHELFADYYSGAVANHNGGSILRCYTKSAFTLDHLPSPSASQHSVYAGGVVGDNTGTVKYCRNDGLVYATSTYRYNWLYAGGIVGLGDVENCYNTGMVVIDSYTTTEYAYAGGISALGYVYNCRNDGDIYLDTALDYDQYAGGIATNRTSGITRYCVVGDSTFTVIGSDRTFKYAYSYNPYDCYSLTPRLHTSEYPELDFETEWMLTENGPIPQGLMDADGNCIVLRAAQVEATCTKTGTVYYDNALTDSYYGTFTIPALGHKYNAWTAVEGADIHAHSCTFSGCGQMEFEAHAWEADKEVAPTCTKDGYGDYSCTCGAEKSVTDTGSALGHSFTQYESDGNATCAADGTKTASCDNGCGATDTLPDVGSALGHSFTRYESDGNATCAADGTKTAACDNGCGETDTLPDVGSVLDHSFTQYVSDGNATCAADGTKTAACDFGCGATDTQPDEGSILDHSFTVYSSNKDATCANNGTESAFCDYGCGAQDTRTVENSTVAHLFTRYVFNNDATCSQEGTATASCDFGCGETHTIFIENSKLPHIWSDVDADFIRICKVCDTPELCDTVSGVTENNLTWTLTYEGHLTVSGTGHLKTGAGWALYSDRIVSVTLDSGITGAEPEVFEDLPNMAALHLGDTVTDLEYDGVSSNCSMLSQITVADGNPSFSAVDGILYSKMQTTLLIYPPAKADTVYVMPSAVMSIAAGAFDGCGNLTSITLSKNLKTVRTGTFADCTGLQNIYISEVNPYFTCDNDVALIQSKGDILICYCVGNTRTDYTVPDGVQTIGDSAFTFAQNLKTMHLPLSLVSVERGAFDECNGLQTVYYPGTENYWATVEVEKWNEELEDALVFGTVDSMSGTCGEYLAWTLSLSDGKLTVTGTGAMTSAPWNRDMIQSVELGFGVTSICDEAFAECGNLSSVDIPDSVTSIGTDAFANCPLETVYYTGSEPRWGMISIASGNTALYTARMVFDSYLVVEWNSAHTVLSVSGEVEDAAYVTAAFYNKAGQMVLVKHYTAAQVRTGTGISCDTADLTRCTAKVMVLDSNYAPVGVAYTPDEEKDIPEDTDYRDLLVLFLDADAAYTGGTIHEKPAIEYMTLDGKTHIAVYDESSGYAFTKLEDIADDGDPENRLFILRKSTKDRVYLERLREKTINDQLDMDEDILNGYVEGDGYTADGTGSVLKIDGWSTNGAVFFVAMEENGKYVYEVMEADDLDGIYDDDTYVQILTRADAKSTTVVGGYLYVTETAPAEHGYLYVTKLLETTADGRKVEAVFEDGTAKTIVIEDGRNDPLKNVLYEYTYNVIDDIYTLSNVPMRRQNNEIEDLDDYEVYTDDGDSMELDDEIIAIFTVEVNYDGAVSADGTPEFSLVNRGVQFVRLKELKLSMIENDVDNRTYTQYTDYRLDSGSLFYVVNYRIMEPAEDAGVELHKYLLDLYECILDGDTIFTV